jgi:membrane protein DedA with SNARE-associated domain
VTPESVLAAAGGTSIGYPLIFGGVLLGSIVPVIPTGAVVGAAAAFAMTSDSLGLPLVLLVSTVAALLGDLATYGVCRFGGPAAIRWVARGQHRERLEQIRTQFHRHGWQLIVAGRLLPAGRIPVLMAAGALAYPWRRLLPAAVLAAFLWAVAYALLGVVSGGVFDSPIVATLIAGVLVLLVGAVLNVVGSRRTRSTAGAGAPEPDPSACGPA